MALTVREASTIWPLNQGQLLAGAKGLDRTITWVHIVEVFDDPYFLSPNILLCTTGYGLQDDEALQRSVLARAHEVGVSAILVKTGYELKQVPKTMLTLADQYAIPLLRFPQHFPFSDVTRALLGRLLDKDVEIMRKSQSLFRRMVEAKLAARSFQEMIRILGETLGATTLIANRRGEVLDVHLVHGRSDRPHETDDTASAGGAEGLSEGVSVLAHMRHYSQRLGRAAGLERLFALNRILALPASADSSPPNLYLAPVRFQNRLHAVIGLVREGRMSDLDGWALECAATVASLEFFRLHVEEETEQRLVGDVLAALAQAAGPGDPLTYHRLAAWGYDLEAPCRVVLVEVAPGNGARTHRILSHLRPVVERYCRADAYTPLISVRDSGMTILRQAATTSLAEERDELQAFRERLSSAIRSATIWLAAGRPSTPAAGLAAGFNEAQRTLEIVRRTHPQGGCLLADDLGLDNLLLDVSQSPRAVKYAQEILAPILQHDRTKQGARLLHTLQTYLAEDCDTQRTAERLFLHPNTVRYRVKTIEELTGRSLSTTSNRAAFAVALRVLGLTGDIDLGAT